MCLQLPIPICVGFSFLHNGQEKKDRKASSIKASANIAHVLKDHTTVKVHSAKIFPLTKLVALEMTLRELRTSLRYIQWVKNTSKRRRRRFVKEID